MRNRRFFLSFVFVFLSFFVSAVFARDFDSPSDQKWQVQQAMKTIDRVNSSIRLCEQAATCPGLINQLFNDDEAGIYGLTSNHRQNCVDKHVKHANTFQDAKEFKKYFAKTFSRNLTRGQQTVIESCSYGNDSFDRFAVSKYYYSLSRLENGATQSIDQIAGIDSLLGKNTLEGVGCGQTIFPEVITKCNQLKAGCKPDRAAAQKNMQILAEETKAAEHNYDEGKKYAEELEKKISALEAPDMVYAKTGEHRSGYEKLPELKEKLAAVKTAIDLTEQNYPWLAGKVYRDARKEGKDYSAAITAQLEYNRGELSSKYMGYRATAGCLIGMNDDENSFCKLESVKKNLNDAPPPLGINSISDEAVSANEYLSAQQCTQEAVVEKEHTKEIVDEVLINVALTAGTAALGPIAFAGRLAVVARGVNLTEKAAKLAMGAADAYWFADGVKQAKNACYGKQEKEMQNAARPTPQNMCPGFDSTLSKMVHEADSCMSARIWAGINGLPFVPAVVGAARVARVGKNIEVATDTARSIERTSESSAKALPGKNILAASEAKTTAKEIGNISEDEIRRNSQLTTQGRIAKFDQYRQELAKKTGVELKPLTNEQKIAIQDAHFESGNLFELKPDEIRRRTEILKKAGFSPAEIRLGMETGIFGQMESQVSHLKVARCKGCDPDMHVVDYTREHSSSHFLEPGKNPLVNVEDALEKARNNRTSVFGDSVSLDEVMTAMKHPVSIRLDEESKVLFNANREKNIEEMLSESGEKYLRFDANLKIRGENYIVKVVTCELPECKTGNQVLHKGDVVTVFPICGPNVYVIPGLKGLRSSAPEKVLKNPCKNTLAKAAENMSRVKPVTAETKAFDKAYAAGKFDDETRYVSVTDPNAHTSQKYEILSKEEGGRLLVKTEKGKIDKINPTEVSIKPNKAAKFYFKARENISGDAAIEGAQKTKKRLERPKFNAEEVKQNARLSDSQKISKLESLRQEMAKKNNIEIPPLTKPQKDAIAKVHQDGAKVFDLTLSQKKERIRILKEAGYSEDDIRLGMDAGIFGSSNDLSVLSSEIRGDKTFLTSYEAGSFSQDTKYVTVVPKPGASGVPLEILEKEANGKLLARNARGEIIRFSPEEAAEIKTSNSGKLLFSYMDREEKKRLEKVWSEVGGRPEYVYPGRRLPSQEVTVALQAQPKLARKIADMYQAIRKTPLENPIKDFRDIPHGKTHIGDPIQNVLAADPRMAGALKDAYNLRNDAESMAVYWRELMKDTAVEMKKSKLARVKEAFAQGEIDYDTMIKVLSDRARARGEKFAVMTGTAEADFRKALREGPFFDQGQAGAKFHGRDVHAIMRDYEYAAVEKNLGKDTQKFYDFLASDGGRGYWDDLNEQGLRTSFASPPYVLKTLPLSEKMIGVRPKINSAPRNIAKPTKAEARLKRPKFTVDEVYKNADLEDAQKVEKFDQLRQEMMRLNKKPAVPMAADEKIKLEKILAEIHSDGGEVYHLTTEQKKRRVRFLKEVGYSDDEIRLGMDAGIFGQGKAVVSKTQAKTNPLKSSDLKFTKKDFVAERQTGTVQHIGFVSDASGGSYKVKKTGKTWNSYFSPYVDNFQGDPRTLAILLGEKGSEFFGFQKVSRNELLLPSAVKMNQKIEDVSRNLIAKKKEPIVVSFYNSDLAKPEVQGKYLDKFEKEFSLPVAIDGHYLIHDVAYHYSAILLPEDLLKVTRAHIRVSRKVTEAMQAATSGVRPELAKMTEEISQRILSRVEHHIDAGTGNVGTLLMREQEGIISTAKTQKELEDLVTYYLTNEDITPKQFVEKYVIEQIENECNRLEKTILRRPFTVKEVQQYEEKMKDAVNKVLQEQKNNPDLEMKYDRSPKEFYDQVKSRLSEIRDASN